MLLLMLSLAGVLQGDISPVAGASSSSGVELHGGRPDLEQLVSNVLQPRAADGGAGGPRVRGCVVST